MHEAHSPHTITDLLYRAPELLRDPSAPPAGTQKGDVFSFAIILYEVNIYLFSIAIILHDFIFTCFHLI